MNPKKEKNRALLFAILYLLVAAYNLYNVTQRYGKDNFRTFIAAILALLFIGWSVSHFMKYRRLGEQREA